MPASAPEPVSGNDVDSDDSSGEANHVTETNPVEEFFA
jgi:hypothetical protein